MVDAVGDLLNVVGELWPNVEWVLLGCTTSRFSLKCDHLHFDVVIMDGGELHVRRKPPGGRGPVGPAQFQWWSTANIGIHHEVLLAFIAASEDNNG
jgi:hypothetical protein